MHLVVLCTSGVIASSPGAIMYSLVIVRQAVAAKMMLEKDALWKGS